MSKDTIYRQDAIDSLCKVGCGSGYCGISCDDVKAIEQLPSAEPEIIRCKDCKHYNAGFECLIEGYGIERDKDWYCADAEPKGEQE